MKPTTEAIITIAAAFLVLFTAMLDPVVSAFIAITALAGLGVYKLAAGRH